MTSSAARIRPAWTAATSASRVDDRAAAGVDEQRPVLHVRDHLGADEPARGVRERREDDHGVGALDRLREPLDRLDAGPRRPRDAPDAHAERREPPLDRAPDRAVADDHHPPAGELARLPALPAARPPRRLGALEADQVGEDRGDDPLRDRGRARVAGVAERDALGDVTRATQSTPAESTCTTSRSGRSASRSGRRALRHGEGRRPSPGASHSSSSTSSGSPPRGKRRRP